MQDFKAKRTPLFNNYRSSPELVRIQHVLAQALDAKSVKPVSKTTGAITGDSCAIWDFPSPEREAERLAAFVATEMEAHDLGPRDFVLLVRQKAAHYAAVLQPAFAAAAGIPLRNEAGQAGAIMLQDSRGRSVRVDHLRTAIRDDGARRPALDGMPGSPWRTSRHRTR